MIGGIKFLDGDLGAGIGLLPSLSIVIEKELRLRSLDDRGIKFLDGDLGAGIGLLPSLSIVFLSCCNTVSRGCVLYD